MIDHIGIKVSDLARSTAFYQASLAPVGYHLLVELDASMTGSVAFSGFGIGQKPSFWVSACAQLHTSTHIAFSVNTRAQVDEFYQAALKAGGTDHGAPGLRPHYHPNYYAAFILDPDGHNIEAVCHHA